MLDPVAELTRPVMAHQDGHLATGSQEVQDTVGDLGTGPLRDGHLHQGHQVGRVPEVGRTARAGRTWMAVMLMPEYWSTESGCYPKSV
jgi:hypothetical protein